MWLKKWAKVGAREDEFRDIKECQLWTVLWADLPLTEKETVGGADMWKCQVISLSMSPELKRSKLGL